MTKTQLEKVNTLEAEKKKATSQLPMFLTKTYHMLDRCNPAIACWADDGDGFIVRDIEKFSKDVLPLYFDHSNYSSFQRQLNYYGFRKIRPDLKMDLTFKAIQFHHPKFQRGKPHLLRQIVSKRVAKAAPANPTEVDDLKGEIRRLEDCIQTMTKEFDKSLTAMSEDFNQQIMETKKSYSEVVSLLQKVVANHRPATPAAANNSTIANEYPRNDAVDFARLLLMFQNLQHNNLSTSLLASFMNVSGNPAPSPLRQPSLPRAEMTRSLPSAWWKLAQSTHKS